LSDGREVEKEIQDLRRKHFTGHLFQVAGCASLLFSFEDLLLPIQSAVFFQSRFQRSDEDILHWTAF
jgi:hypothetical protein